MPDTPIHFWVLIVGLAGLLVVPPVFQAAMDVRDGGQVYAVDLVRTIPTTDALRDFERGLEDRSWVVHQARQLYGAFADHVFERGNRTVVFGEDEWLFHRQSVDFVTSPDFRTSRARRLLGLPDAGTDPLSAVIDFHRQLDALGIALIVVPVPVKATLYPEQLWPKSAPMAMPNNPGVSHFVEGLRRRGVEVVDAGGVLLDLKKNGTPVFLPRDTHWTPEGMGAVAQAIVDRVGSLPVVTGSSFVRAQFDHRAVVFEGQGDVTGMLDYAAWADPFAPMTFQLRQIVATGDGRLPTGDEASPFLLLGDSLTNVFSGDDLEMGRRGGLGEQIADGLAVTFDGIASPGGGATRSRQSLALRPGGLAGKRVVVWVFTERDLLFSQDGWAMVDVTATDTSAIEDAPPTSLTTRARLTAVTDTSRTPDYADCLIIAKYEHLDGDRPAGRDEFFVAYWGWQDWVRTSAAAFRTGEVHDLSLSRLTNDLNLENTCWVDSVGLNAAPWWAAGDPGR